MRVAQLKFKKTQGDRGDMLFGYNTDLGVITVLNRMTGHSNGVGDIETGFTDNSGKFWLAAGGFDIREYPNLELSQAIEKIKRYANTCVGV